MHGPGESFRCDAIMVRPLVSKDNVQTDGRPTASAAIRAALNSSSDDMVSIQATSAPPSFRPAIGRDKFCGNYLCKFWLKKSQKIRFVGLLCQVQ